jgi:hypothetical protein
LAEHKVTLRFNCNPSPEFYQVLRSVMIRIGSNLGGQCLSWDISAHRSETVNAEFSVCPGMWHMFSLVGQTHFEEVMFLDCKREFEKYGVKDIWVERVRPVSSEMRLWWL